MGVFLETPFLFIFIINGVSKKNSKKNNKRKYII